MPSPAATPIVQTGGGAGEGSNLHHGGLCVYVSHTHIYIPAPGAWDSSPRSTYRLHSWHIHICVSRAEWCTSHSHIHVWGRERRATTRSCTTRPITPIRQTATGRQRRRGRRRRRQKRRGRRRSRRRSKKKEELARSRCRRRRPRGR